MGVFLSNLQVFSAEILQKEGKIQNFPGASQFVSRPHTLLVCLKQGASGQDKNTIQSNVYTVKNFEIIKKRPSLEIFCLFFRI